MSAHVSELREMSVQKRGGDKRNALEGRHLRAHFDVAEFAVHLVGERAAACRAAHHVGGGHHEALDAGHVVQPAEAQPVRHHLRVGPRIAIHKHSLRFYRISSI